jgi:hypothetical protein
MSVSNAQVAQMAARKAERVSSDVDSDELSFKRARPRNAGASRGLLQKR